MSSTVAPILRLYQTIWTSVAAHLEPNDVMRLMAIGEPHLCASLLRCVEHFRVTWSTARYVDFSRLFALVHRFQAIYHLELNSDVLYWRPIDWDATICSRLVSLRLRMIHISTELLGKGNLRHIFPLLEVLDLGSAPSSSLIASKISSRASFDFRGLPPLLRHLHVSLQETKVSVCMVVTHLEHLPPQLETLSLDFKPTFYNAHFPTPEGFQDDAPPPPNPAWYTPIRVDVATLPKLPDSLTRLVLESGHIFPSSSCRWYVDGGALPKSLLHFQMNGPADLSLQPPTLFSAEPSILNVSRLRDHLPDLRTFVSSQMVWKCVDLLAYMPQRSLTHLEIKHSSLLPHMEEKLDFAFKSLKRASSQYFQEWLDRPNVRFPKLASLQLQDTPRALKGLTKEELQKKLPAITELDRTALSGAEFLPPTLLSFEGLLEQSIKGPVTFGAPNLRRLTIFDLPRELVLALPSTIESISSIMSLPEWEFLLEHAHSALPNLRQLQNSGHLPYRCLSGIPKQVQELEVSLQSETFSPTPPEAFYTELAHSTHIRSLSISCTSAHIPGDTLISVLDHLPQKLRKLRFVAPQPLQTTWPITLPPTLTVLVFESYSDGRPGNRIQTLQDSSIHHLRPNALVLPPTLCYLDISVVEHIKPSDLPPFLSYCSLRSVMNAPMVEKPYVQTRWPPTTKDNWELVILQQ